MTVTSLDGTTTYAEYSYSESAVTEIIPIIYYRTCDLEINNLCVAYDLTDNKTEIQNVYEELGGKDTNDVALVCVNNYNKAVETAEAILSNIDYYTRNEINSAAADITLTANSFEKYGDVNLDKETDLRDLVRLKKITIGVEEETVPADMDADGDILAVDVVLLVQRIMK